MFAFPPKIPSIFCRPLERRVSGKWLDAIQPTRSCPVAVYQMPHVFFLSVYGILSRMVTAVSSARAVSPSPATSWKCILITVNLHDADPSDRPPMQQIGCLLIRPFHLQPASKMGPLFCSLSSFSSPFRRRRDWHFGRGGGGFVTTLHG